MQQLNNLEIKQQVLFINDLEKLIGRNRATLRRWWIEDRFPRPVKLNESTLAWHIEAVEQWINQTIKLKAQKEDSGLYLQNS